MLNMLQTKKLNEKYFVNKINKFSFNLYIPKYISKWVFKARKCNLLDCQMLLKYIFLYLKYIFKNIQKNKWPKTYW